MSIGSRIKEAREIKDMSRNKLAELIGVTSSAIANYENGISSPKLDLMYKLFNSLDCDANYLFQDEMNDLKDVSLSASERIMIHNYRELDVHGREMVDFTLQKEWERSLKYSTNNIVALKVAEESPSYTRTNAAHDKNNVSEEAKQNEEPKIQEKMREEIAKRNAMMSDTES